MCRCLPGLSILNSSPNVGAQTRGKWGDEGAIVPAGVLYKTFPRQVECEGAGEVEGEGEGESEDAGDGLG